jgi:hypothetical protein
MALYSWSDLYRDPASSLVNAPFAAIENAEKPLNREPFLKADPTEIEPWKFIMQRNTPGQSPAGAPVFIAQGSADTAVRPEITRRASREGSSMSCCRASATPSPPRRASARRSTGLPNASGGLPSVCE